MSLEPLWLAWGRLATSPLPLNQAVSHEMRFQSSTRWCRGQQAHARSMHWPIKKSRPVLRGYGEEGIFAGDIRSRDSCMCCFWWYFEINLCSCWLSHGLLVYAQADLYPIPNLLMRSRHESLGLTILGCQSLGLLGLALGMSTSRSLSFKSLPGGQCLGVYGSHSFGVGVKTQIR